MAAWESAPVVGSRPAWESAPVVRIDPTADMGTTERVLAGVGMGMARVGRAVGQAVGLVSQADIDEAKRLEAPLENTTAGKVGGVVGQAAAVAPTMLIPGVNTYTGAALTGAGIGGLTTEGGLKDRALGAAAGGVGGIAGKGLGDLIGKGANWIRDLGADRIAASAPRNALVRQALDEGYVLPPTEINPSVTNSVIEGLSGKIKTSQSASAKNADVTAGLAKRDVGAAPDAPLTREALDVIRRQAGQAYDAVATTGTITPAASYSAALDRIVAPFKTAAQGFPQAKANPIIGEIEALKSPQFDAAAAVAKISELRGAADEAYASGSKLVGKSYKSAANALEDVLDEHLQAIGAPAEVLSAFRDARQLIAKTYSVERALNPTTGEVSAKALGQQLQRGKPLSGDLLTIAQTAQAFPKATQTLPQNFNALSPLDFAAAMLSGNPLGLVARPTLRAAALSGPAQSVMARERTNAMRELLAKGANSDLLQSLIPGSAGVFAPSLQK